MYINLCTRRSTVVCIAGWFEALQGLRQELRDGGSSPREIRFGVFKRPWRYFEGGSKGIIKQIESHAVF